MRWIGHAARIRKKMNAYGILMEKQEGKKTLGGPKRSCEDNKQRALKGIIWNCMDWIDLSQDRD
jgi:hypothetical protein